MLRLHGQSDQDMGDAPLTRQTSPRDDLIDTMIRDEDGYVFAKDGHGFNSYHGNFAGLSMLRTVRDLCTRVSGAPIPPDDLTGRALAEAFDSNVIDLPQYNRMAQFALLPPYERMHKIVGIALDNAMNLKECIDRVQLERQIRHLYNRDPEDYTQDDRHASALLYALLALGRRHEPSSEESADSGSNMIVLKGMSYFRAARSIIDLTDCHDLNTIRALIIMSYYLASSSMMSKAYSCICAAAASALRMGLHVSSASQRHIFTNKELTERRQVFAVLCIVDTLTATTLGMPNILRDADPRQLIPCREEDLADEGRAFAESNPLSPVSESILAAKLFRIQSSILQTYFPMSSLQPNEARRYLRHEDVVRHEAALLAWHETLPAPSPKNVDRRALRSQLLLRFAYSHVQITLYRPFLHHLVRDRRDADFDFRGYAFGSACIRAVTQSVLLIDTMDKNGFLHEAQWFNIVALAFASSALNLFVLGMKEGPTVQESRSAAIRARELLNKLGARNASARRCYESLSKIPAADDTTGTSNTTTTSSAALEVAGGDSGEVEHSGSSNSSESGSAGALSPRTRFMQAIGALDPIFFEGVEDPVVGRGSDEGEGEESVGSEGMRS